MPKPEAYFEKLQPDRIEGNFRDGGANIELHETRSKGSTGLAARQLGLVEGKQSSKGRGSATCPTGPPGAK